MCGITGFLTKDSRLNKGEAQDLLSKMCQSIWYRGPDDHGIYVFGFDNNQNVPLKVGLGHNRLSIIDLSSAGCQPMSNEDNSIWLTYNGEIYNFLELRESLVKKGHKFRSKTDTEVVIHSWEEWQEECVHKFNGMFAFALWDRNKNTLFVARDRMGQKPLYYTQTKGQLIFASELKAILKHPDIAKEIDLESLRKYLAYEYIPAPRTIFQGIQKLPAGYWLRYRDDKIEINKYWDLNFNLTFPGRIEDCCCQVKSLFRLAIKRRLVSDVPLGVFLSGGIDSSSIVAFMAGMMPSKAIKTFSIGFKDSSFDESSYARKVACYFGTDHHEEILEPKRMLEIFSEAISNLDEPFADASIIPTYLLSKFTRRYATVALSGDGGDELFCGYPTFPAHKLAKIYEKIPRFIHKEIVERLASLLPVSCANFSFDFKVKQFLSGVLYPMAVRHQIWLGSFSPQRQVELLAAKDKVNLENDHIYSEIINFLKDVVSRDDIEKIIYFYTKLYLQEDILTKTDRASMANSLEVRAPFLDHQFVEFICSIPSQWKLKGLRTKYIFKKAMEDMLPKDIIHRPKKGFGIPVAKWIKEDLKGLTLDAFAKDKIKREGFFDYSFIQQLLKEHFAGKKDNRKQLWTLLTFELWYERYR